MEKRPKESKSSKAGLQFPVSRFQRHLRKGNYANQVGTAGSVYLTGVIEYLVAEILELSGTAARENNRLRIAPRHIMLAIKNDAELNELLKDAHFSESGVMPNIHPVLFNKSKPKRVARVVNDNGGDDNEGDEEEDDDQEEENDEEEDDDQEEDDDEDSVDASVVVGSQNF